MCQEMLLFFWVFPSIYKYKSHCSTQDIPEQVVGQSWSTDGNLPTPALEQSATNTPACLSSTRSRTFPKLSLFSQAFRNQHKTILRASLEATPYWQTLSQISGA